LSYFQSPIRFSAAGTMCRLVTEQAHRSPIRTRDCISRNVSAGSFLGLEASHDNSDSSIELTILAVNVAMS